VASDATNEYWDWGPDATWGTADDGWVAAVPCWVHPSWPAPVSLSGATWIWRVNRVNPAIEYNTLPPEGYRTFRKVFDIPSSAVNITGTITINADNAYELYINGSLVDSEGAMSKDGPDKSEWNTVRTTDCTSALQTGTNTIEIHAIGYFFWGTYSSNPAGVIYKLRVDYETATVKTLCAGQNMDVGTVSVWNDGTDLYVKYETTGDWVMTETHLAVVTDPEDFPVTKTGNPKVGNFPFSDPHGPVTDYTYIIKLDEEWEDLYIAAHAVVYKLVGEGCESPQWASSVVAYNQGTLKNGNPVTDPARIDPDKARGAPDASTSPPAIGFYSLGYVTNGDGWLELSFDYPVFNTAGDDIVVYEVTWGRPSYPVEKAEVWVQADGDWYLAGEVTNKDNGTGIGSVSIPDGILLVNAVKLVDSTDDPNLSGSADGYDVDAVGACYLVEQEETAWGDGCDGTSFPGENWATYFMYHVEE